MFAFQKPEEEDEGSDDSIEAALEKEVCKLKSKRKSERRFQQVESGANNCIFIKTTLADPAELVRSIFSDVYDSEAAKSRYIMRLLPVIGTCKCNEEKIKKLAEDVLKVYFTDTFGHTFSINVKVRNNNAMGRKQVLPLLAAVIKDLNPANHPDLDNPEYIVNVDILKTILCISVLKDSVKFRKYNLQEVASAKSSTRFQEKVCDDISKTENETSQANFCSAVTEMLSDNKEGKPQSGNNNESKHPRGEDR